MPDKPYTTYVDEHPDVEQRLQHLFGADGAQEREATFALSTFTGIPSLDAVLGRLPMGIIELSGAESTGKTGLCYHIAAAAQREQRPVLLLGTEILDVPYMARAGVDTRNLPVLLGYHCKRDFIDFLQSHENAVALLDSLTALRPQAEEALTDWNDMAFELCQEFRRVLRPGSCIVLTSQVRAKPGSVRGLRSASRRFEDFFDTQLELSREEVTETAYRMIVKVKAHPFTQPRTYLRLPAIKGSGVDIDLDLIEAAERLRLITRKGPWYYLKDLRLGLGAEDMKRCLQDPEVREALTSAVYSRIRALLKLGA